jgi:peptidoglycan/LPS O-acetylase OafA/YrhL
LAAVTLTALFIMMLGGEIFSINLSQYIYNLSMISGYFGVNHVDGAYWTLLVEIKFYFIIFVLLMTRLLKYVFYFMVVWAAISGISFFYELNSALVFFMFPEYSGYFIAGGVFYIIRCEGLSISRILLIFVAYALSLHSSIIEMHHLEAYYSTPFSVSVVVAIISAFYILFLMVALGKTSIVNHPKMLFLGALTYPLYLIHQNIGFMLFGYFGGFNKYIVLFITLAFVIFMAYLINRQIEVRYAKRLKNWLLKICDFLPIFRLPPKAIKD